jgi:hypothetical protein
MTRRLPVIQSDTSDDAVAASRPRVHWIFIGAGFVATIWAPLALLVTPFGAAALLSAFFVASLLSGALVGRFGGRAGPREAALGGLVAGAALSVLGLRPDLGLPVSTIIAAFSALSLLGVIGGALGGAWGRSRR